MNLPPLQATENENRLKTLKNTYSKAGLTMFLGIVAVYAVQIILSVVLNYFIDVGTIEKGNIYVNLLLSFLPMYVVCFPVMFLPGSAGFGVMTPYISAVLMNMVLPLRPELLRKRRLHGNFVTTTMLNTPRSTTGSI